MCVINPRRACAARVTVVFIMYVHMYVHMRARAVCRPKAQERRFTSRTADGHRDIQLFYALNCPLSRDTPLRS